jgi:hypothetical protein
MSEAVSHASSSSSTSTEHPKEPHKKGVYQTMTHVLASLQKLNGLFVAVSYGAQIYNLIRQDKNKEKMVSRVDFEAHRGYFGQVKREQTEDIQKAHDGIEEIKGSQSKLNERMQVLEEKMREAEANQAHLSQLRAHGLRLGVSKARSDNFDAFGEGATSRALSSA